MTVDFETSNTRLLAIDVGLKMGVAMFDETGKLVHCQARKISGRAQLKTAAYRILQELKPTILYLEGGGGLADVWSRQAEKLTIPVRQVHALDWRRDLLYLRERRKGKDAKRHAEFMALRIIEWSNAKRPTSMCHDLAEAITFGFWGVWQEGWISEIPKEVKG